MDIKLPELGEGIEAGDVLSVLVSEGDTVEKEQGLIELETDKASVEIPSTHAGKITKIHVSEGDTLQIGGVIVSLETSDAASQSTQSPLDNESAAQLSPAEEATKSEAAPSAAEQEPAEAPTQPEPKQQPVVSTQRPDIPTEQTTQRTAASEPQHPNRRSTDSPAQSPALGGNGDIIPAGPAMRRFAREVGVDLQNVTGSGPGGRVTRGDILRVVRDGPKSSAPAATAVAEPEAPESKPAAQPDEEATQQTDQSSAAPGEKTRDDWGPIRVAKLPKIRQTIAAKMFESWSTIPRVTNFDDADITELEQVRQSSKADYASVGIKLTQMPFVIKACAAALRANPVLNASIDMESGEVIYKEYVNIGIAVDTERGLVVPSLRGADHLSIPDIARNLAELAVNVKTGKFAIEDLRGSSFTISNLGAIGGTYSTPIINPPEVAILLLGRSRKVPVVVDHQFAVRLQIPLSLSYDHRLVDGAAAARFLNDVKSFLQSPSRLLLTP